MERPERPSRHRGYDKWKRILEPSGDSDSSEWSSDSDMGMGMNAFRSYRHLDSTLGNGSSSNGNREQHSSVNANMNTNGHSKLTRESSSIFHSLEPYNYMFDPAVETKRYEGYDPGAGTSTNYNHLLHHDYAEREVNNDRSSSEPMWYHHPVFTSSIALERKRPSVRAMVYRPTTNTASTSNCALPSVTTSEEGATQDPDNGNAVSTPASNNGVNLVVNQEDEEGWAVVSNMRRLNSPSRKRSLFMSSDSTAVGSVETSNTNDRAAVIPGKEACSSIAVPGPSLPTQTQAGQHESFVTSANVEISSPDYVCPSGWYVPKKVQTCYNKQVRFSDNTFRRMVIEPNSGSEDRNHVSRISEDPAEIQVLSMAGPSNGPSRIVYPPSTRRMHLVGPEESVSEETSHNTSGAAGTVEAEDGVEVIMVDDTQPESSAEKRTVSQSSAGSIKEQQSKEDEHLSPASKRMKEDDELLNQGLIGLLECPVCMEYMGPPIHQCRRGHLVCSSCKPKLPSCPTCRSRFTECRNLAMEKVADKLHYPCKNAHMGCTDTLRLCEKDEHEANCAYRSYRCIMVPPCEWKGQHHDILSHVSTAHSETLLQGSEHTLEMHLGDLTEQSSQNWVLSALGELFRVNLGAVRGGRVQVFGCVLLLGPARRAPLFRYTLSVGPAEGDSTQRNLLYSRTTHCYVERCSVYYSAGDSFHLRTESAQLFSSGPPNDLTLHVKLHIKKLDSRASLP